MKSIFLSYSWNDSNIADQLDVMFKIKGIMPTRDIRDVEYKSSIKEYMKKVRFTDYCLMIISKNYLTSRNCLYEVLEFVKDDNYKEKILPIIKTDVDVYSAEKRAGYVKYWQDEFTKLNSIRSEIDPLNQPDVILELKILENIQRSIGEFLSIISDMKLFSIDKDIPMNIFNKIYKTVESSFDESLQLQSSDGYFVLNVPRTMIDRIFVWWESNSKGYTQDMRNAKVFTYDEIKNLLIDLDYPEWNNKKYLAIPVVDVAMKLESYIIPYAPYYLDKLRKLSKLTIGNKSIHLTSEEIDNYL
jgi:hypothetical protein